MFSPEQVKYLEGQMLGRLGTASPDGAPHVVPVGFRVDVDRGVIEIGGHEVPGRPPRRYRRNIEANPRVAFVVDDLGSVDPWWARGVSLRGRAVVHDTGGERLGTGFGPIWVEITPDRVWDWGLDGPMNFTRE
jgi:pyridoxamine 5'-phosphate oxidase family protein